MRWLDITMDDAFEFKIVTSVKQNVRKPQHCLYRLNRIAAQHLAIHLAIDEFFSDKKMLNSTKTFSTEIDDPRNVRSADLLHRRNFALRTLVSRCSFLNDLKHYQPRRIVAFD